jgi:hypothetical protein
VRKYERERERERHPLCFRALSTHPPPNTSQVDTTQLLDSTSLMTDEEFDKLLSEHQGPVISLLARTEFPCNSL